MKTEKEIKLNKVHNNWNTFSESEAGRQSANWTLVQRCLNGTASEQEYNSLDGCYASYNGDFTYVGPSFGPLTITGPNALKAWNRVSQFDDFAS